MEQLVKNLTQSARPPRSLVDELLYPELPWPLHYVPPVCRFLCTLIMAPVVLLLVIDVGGYLLFKLFYRPFGTYPRYSYFKQATREPFERGPSASPSISPSLRTIPLIHRTPASSHSLADDSRSPSSPSTPSSTPSDSQSASALRRRNPATQDYEDPSLLTSSPVLTPTMNGKKEALEERRGKDGGDEEEAKRRLMALQMRKGSTFRARAESVGVEGPLLESDDLRSPSGSEYGGDESDREAGGSPRTPSSFLGSHGDSSAPSSASSSFSGKKGFGMTPVR